jgi:PAS domain S-box-containing protein
MKFFLRFSTPLTIVLFYAVLSILWSVANHQILLPLVGDLLNFVRVDLFTDVLFVFIASPALYYIIHRYIHNQKKIEQALISSENRYRSLFRNAPVGVFHYDTHLRITECNDRFARILQSERERLLGLDMNLLKDRSVIPVLLSALEGKEDIFEGFYRATFSPAEVWISMRTAPVFGQTGLVEGGMAMVEDISERKKAEAQIFQIKQDWEDTFNTITDMITIHDANFDIIRANTSAQKILGLPFLESAKAKCYAFYHGTECPPAECPSCQSLKTGELSIVEIFEPHLNMFIEITAIPRFDNSGKIAGLIHVVRDISERKKADEHLQEQKRFSENLIQNSAVATFVLDSQHKVLLWNKACEELTGMPAAAMIGTDDHWKAFYDRRRPCLADIIMNKDFSSMATLYQTYGKSPLISSGLHAERWITNLGGKDRYIIFDAAPIYNSKDELVASVETLQDITEIRKLEDQLKQAQKMEAIGQLAAGIAHDFNNILTAIIGYGTMLQMKLDKNDLSMPYLEQILSAAGKATTLTHSLLAFSRKQIINPQAADLNDIVRSVAKLLSRLIGEDIELRLNLLQTALPVRVDIGQIDQVLMNLCSNARDSMPDGGFISIETDYIELTELNLADHPFMIAGPYAILSLSDTGEGMDEKTIEKIFEPFFTTKEMGKGTGLGLSIVYGIIKQHNGYITVYSEQGNGTTFRIYLPLTRRDALKEDAQKSVDPPQGGKECILIAEDDPQVRALTGKILDDFGYQVLIAADGEEAVNVFLANIDHIDLVILDVIMPKLNGMAALDRMRSIKPDIRALFTSGYTADVIHKKGILDKGLNYLSKPLAPEVLLRKIRNILDAG